MVAKMPTKSTATSTMGSHEKLFARRIVLRVIASETTAMTTRRISRRKRM